jgi:hypothetical protein
MVDDVCDVATIVPLSFQIIDVSQPTITFVKIEK